MFTFWCFSTVRPDFHTGPYYTGFQPVKLVPVLKLKEAIRGTQKPSSLTSLIVVLTILLAKMKKLPLGDWQPCSKVPVVFFLFECNFFQKYSKMDEDMCEVGYCK